MYERNKSPSTQELNRMIIEAYRRDLKKPELVSFKEVSRWGRKYGFPVVCTLADQSEEKQIHWAASLLIQVADTWPREDMPELLTPERGSELFNDAEQLLANGLGAASQLHRQYKPYQYAAFMAVFFVSSLF